MARITFFLLAAALLMCATVFAEEREKRLIIDKITDKVLGKRCSEDSDCDVNQCCVPRHILGKRCRNLLDEGDYCATGFFQAALDRIVRRCPCQSGLSCKYRRSIGLYKIYKCQQDN
ncbi:uncharacterized protein LOC135692791 [Rhopilema esculentum]|uniref:uncharacterized protein LOC135692790 n=1 Tax=Rhopilema esculentum TaxID=499914 RepID=UPI0031D2D929